MIVQPRNSIQFNHEGLIQMSSENIEIAEAQKPRGEHRGEERPWRAITKKQQKKKSIDQEEHSLITLPCTTKSCALFNNEFHMLKKKW